MLCERQPEISPQLTHHVLVRGSVSQLRWLIRAGPGGIPDCRPCWGLLHITGLGVPDLRNARFQEHTGDSEPCCVMALEESSPHCLFHSCSFGRSESHMAWLRSVRQGGGQCLRGWGRPPSLRARRKFLSFRDSIKNWEQLSNQL